MNTLQQIRTLNAHLKIKEMTDFSFSIYGRIIKHFDFTPVNQYIEQHFAIPDDRVDYVPLIDPLQDLAITEQISDQFYGQMPIQIGYCSGVNTRLNGLEYHKGSELTIALTDLLIIVGQLFHINNDQYDSKNAEIYYIPKGAAFELFATTLHYAPCMVERSGFKTVVILPKGTNFPLNLHTTAHHDKFLFMKNKWLLCHPENAKDIERGGQVGIVGENISINWN